MGTLRTFLTIVALGGVAACTHVPPSPFPTDFSPARNKRYDKSPVRENRYGLPAGTLTSESSLIVMDASRVCFDVVLRALAARRDLSDLRNWRIFLEGEPEFRYDHPDLFLAGEPEFQRFTGYRRIYATLEKYVCNSQARCFTKTTTYPEGLVEETDETVAMSAAVCFPNLGAVNQATRTLKLALEDPRTSALSRQYATFEWELSRGVIREE